MKLIKLASYCIFVLKIYFFRLNDTKRGIKGGGKPWKMFIKHILENDLIRPMEKPGLFIGSINTKNKFIGNANSLW